LLGWDAEVSVSERRQVERRLQARWPYRRHGTFSRPSICLANASEWF